MIAQCTDTNTTRNRWFPICAYWCHQQYAHPLFREVRGAVVGGACTLVMVLSELRVLVPLGMASTARHIPPALARRPRQSTRQGNSLPETSPKPVCP